MFCPKCGTKNPDDGKFCRSCGVDLGSVSAAMSGSLDAFAGPFDMDAGTAHIKSEARRRNDPAEVYGDSIKAIISGLGFLVISLVLLMTGVAGGKAWWWAMLFPAFTFLAKGISDLLKSRKMESLSAMVSPKGFTTPVGRPELVSTPEEYLSPESGYKTGDLVPPSVTDNTTRHLEIDKDGETMTLPKR